MDILINNAGIVVGKPFLDVPDALAEKVVQVNTICTLCGLDKLLPGSHCVLVSPAHFWTTKAFLPGSALPWVWMCCAWASWPLILLPVLEWCLSVMRRNHGHVVTIASAAGLAGVVGLGDCM